MSDLKFLALALALMFFFLTMLGYCEVQAHETETVYHMTYPSDPIYGQHSTGLGTIWFHEDDVCSWVLFLEEIFHMYRFPAPCTWENLSYQSKKDHVRFWGEDR